MAEQLPSWRQEDAPELPSWEPEEPSAWSKVGSGIETALAPLSWPKHAIDWTVGKVAGLPEGQSVGQGLESFIERTGFAPEPVSMLTTTMGDFLNQMGQEKLGKIVTKVGARAAGAGLDLVTDPLSWAGAGFARLPRLVQAGVSAAFSGQMGKAAYGHVKTSLAKLQEDPHDADAWANLVSAGLETVGGGLGVMGVAHAAAGKPAAKAAETASLEPPPKLSLEEQFRAAKAGTTGDLLDLGAPPSGKPDIESQFADVQSRVDKLKADGILEQAAPPALGEDAMLPGPAYDREPNPVKLVLDDGHRLDVVNSTEIEGLTPHILEAAGSPEVREVAALFRDAVSKFSEAHGLPTDLAGIEYTQGRGQSSRGGIATVVTGEPHEAQWFGNAPRLSVFFDPWVAARRAFGKWVSYDLPQFGDITAREYGPAANMGVRFAAQLRSVANHEVAHFAEGAEGHGGTGGHAPSPEDLRLGAEFDQVSQDVAHRAAMRAGLGKVGITKLEEMAATPEGQQHLKQLAKAIAKQADTLDSASQFGEPGGRSNVMAALNAENRPPAAAGGLTPPPVTPPPGGASGGAQPSGKAVVSLEQPRWLQYLNAMKSVASSLDLSGALRHGVVFSMRHPVEASKMLYRQIGAFAKQANYDVLNDTMKADPRYAEAIRDGTNIHQAGAGLNAHDLYYGSKIIADAFQKLGIPEWNWVSRSERAFTYFLNQARLSQYKYGRQILADVGITDPAAFKAVGDWANLSTGGLTLPPGVEGGARMLKSAEPLLATIFYSPRLVASRIALMYPGTYLKALSDFGGAKNPAAWKALGKLHALDMAAYISMVGATSYATAKLFGGTINEDPRSSDFGKVRIGDTRVDFWGGLQPYMRAAAQLVTGQRTSKWGVTRETPRTDVAASFLRSRLAPGPGLAWTALSGTDYRGQPFWGATGDVVRGEQPLTGKVAGSIAATAGGRLVESLAPMAPRDIMDIATSGNMPLAMAMALPIIAGVGASVHDPEAGMSPELREELYRTHVEPLKKVKTISLGIDVTGKTLSQHVPYMIQQDVEQLANKPLYDLVQQATQSETYRSMPPKMQQLFLNELIRDLNSVKQDKTLSMLPPPLIQSALQKEQQTIAELPRW